MAARICFVFLFGFAYSNAQQDYWTETKGPFGGGIPAFTVAPNGAIFAVCPSRVFRSTNSGADWKRLPLNTVGYSGAFQAIAADSNNIIFLGAIYQLNAFGGISRSTDLGETWTRTSHANAICFAVNSPGYIFAGSTNGLLRSTDQGITWTALLANARNCRSIACVQSIVLAATDSGVYRSTDNGLTWQHSNSGLPNSVITSVLNASRGFSFAATYAGVFRSSNNGASWISIGLSSDSLTSLASTPAGNLIAGTRNGKVLRSSNDGITWDTLQRVASSVLALHDATNFNGFIASVEKDGLFRNNGTPLNLTHIGIPNTSVISLASDSRERIFASEYNRLWYTTNKGEQWHLLRSFEDRIRTITLVPRTRQTLLGVGNKLYRSTNNGITFDSTRVDSAEVVSVAMDSSGWMYAAVFLAGIFRSTDDGATWTQINNGLTSRYVSSINVNRLGYLFATTNGAGVQRSTDRGNNWANADNGTTGNYVWSSAINSLDHVYVSGNGGTFKTTDHGASWVNTDPNRLILGSSIAFNSRGDVFVGTSGGVYLSTNQGTDWNRVVAGLTERYVLSVCVDRDDYAFAGTAGTGVFRSIERTITATSPHEGQPDEFVLHQNYPNPFNPTTRIEYAIPKTSHVSLKVFDVLGREVATLVDEVQDVGVKSLEFDATNFSSGIYFYQMRADGFVQTRKLMAIR